MMEEQAQSATPRNDLIGDKSSDVIQDPSPQADLYSKDGKEQEITSQGTERTDTPKTSRKDITAETHEELTGELTELASSMPVLKQQIEDLVSTLKNCVDNNSWTADDETRLENENSNCGFCSVTKDRIKSIYSKFDNLSNTWKSVGDNMLQAMQELSLAVLELKRAFETLQPSSASGQYT